MILRQLKSCDPARSWEFLRGAIEEARGLKHGVNSLLRYCLRVDNAEFLWKRYGPEAIFQT